jgi:hypothetical protein
MLNVTTALVIKTIIAIMHLLPRRRSLQHRHHTSTDESVRENVPQPATCQRDSRLPSSTGRLASQGHKRHKADVID